ncbi:hypothetical protein V8C40DRAFT_267018 [Trichoderma camerunense]
MIFPIFNMPCLHNHHQPPHNHHSRDFHDGEMSSSAAIGLAVGLTLIAVIIAALIYCWCWRQHDRHKKHRRQNSHRCENQVSHVTAEKKQAQQRQDGSTQTEQNPPLPKVPLSIHHHQHDDKHFHGDHYHDHIHEGDHILDCPDHNDGPDIHGHSRQNSHGHHRHRHSHHRFHRTHQILLPRDPIAEFEELISPLSPGIPDATRADLEAILNGLDIPLPNEPVRVNSRADVNVDQQGAARHEEESRERRKKHHHHHHHHHRHRRCHRHKRVTVH